MPQLTPIMEADNDDDEEKEEGEVFAATGDAAAANRPHHQDDSISHHSDEVISGNLDLTFVTPMASPEMTPAASGNSTLTGSGDLLAAGDAADQAGAEIGDDLSGGNEVAEHESSYSGVYSNYLYGGDDYMTDLSPGGGQLDWSSVVEGDVRAQGAVLALGRRGGRLTSQQLVISLLNVSDLNNSRASCCSPVKIRDGDVI